MDIYTACMLAEGDFAAAGYDPDLLDQDEAEELTLDAWQLLIDSGLCWQLQGSFGRQAMALIEAGICSPAA